MRTPSLSTQKIQVLCILTVFVAASFAGCLSNTVSFPKCDDKDNCLTIAFEAKEEYSNTEENPQEFADRLSDLIGMDVEIYPVTGAAGMIEALRFGHADIGFLDGGAAWLSWQTAGLQVMAAEQKADGRAYYNAIAWVHKDSDMAQADMDDDPDTDPYALMAGKTSCHTSALGSSGMLLPMGFMITNEYIQVVGDPDEIDSLTDTVRNHFSEDSSIPNSGTKYHKYQGSLRCLAEHEGGTANDYISLPRTQRFQTIVAKTHKIGALKVGSNPPLISTESTTPVPKTVKGSAEPPAILSCTTLNTSQQSKSPCSRTPLLS